MDDKDAFSAFLDGLEDVLDEIDPVVDFGAEKVLPVGATTQTSGIGQVAAEPLTYLSGIMSTAGETTNAPNILQDGSDLLLLN